METSSQFAFRAPDSFIDETTEAARMSGLSRSAYARRAIEEANARAMQRRIAALSRQLAAHTGLEVDALDGASADGLTP